MLGQGTVGDDGTFSVVLDEPQLDGEALEVTQSDGSGNESAPTGATSPDTTAPDAPTNVVVSDDGTTVSGSGEPGASVTVTGPDDTVLGQGTVGDDGTFSVVLDEPQLDGEALGVTQTDASDNESAPANATAPDATAPELPTIALTNDTGTPGDGITSDGAITLSGLEPGATWEFSFDAGNTWDTGTGIEFVLEEGDYAAGDVQVRQTDVAGNSSAVGRLGAVSVDSTAPEVPMVDPSDGTLLAGTSEPGAAINIAIDGDESLGLMAMADGAGNWSVSIDPALPDGAVVRITASDQAGNTSSAATITTDAVLVDTTPPAAPVIATGMDSVDPEQGEFASGTTINDSQPTLTGSAEAGSTVALFEGGNALGAVVANEQGRWSFTPDGPLADGNYAYTAKATDVAGNESVVSNEFSFSVDTLAPSLMLDSLAITNDVSPELSGSVDDLGASIAVTVNGTDYSATNNGDGTWTLADDILDALGEGDTTVTVTATDAAGNETVVNGIVTIDFTGPVDGDGRNSVVFGDGGDGLLSVAEATSVTLSGKIEVGSSIDSITITDGSVSLTVSAADITVDADTGAVSVAGQDLSGLADGELTVSTTVTDVAGNTGTVTDTTTLDTTAPDAPTNVVVSDDGTTVSGSGEPGASVTVTGPDDTVLGQGTVGDDG
ncbi:Ig-like domain-containing protein, partial [Halomonas sp. V046]|uniref:Ig-like domain-containing protein n=1 Tax=Halomonas sp. V046 TaxID=3459611 RepID=UPI0040446CCA